MELINREFQKQAIDGLLSMAEPLVKERYAKSEFVTIDELAKELGVNKAFIPKLEAHGLKRIQLEKGGRIFYNRQQAYDAINKLAK